MKSIFDAAGRALGLTPAEDPPSVVRARNETLAELDAAAWTDLEHESHAARQQALQVIADAEDRNVENDERDLRLALAARREAADAKKRDAQAKAAAARSRQNDSIVAELAADLRTAIHARDFAMVCNAWRRGVERTHLELGGKLSHVHLTIAVADEAARPDLVGHDQFNTGGTAEALGVIADAAADAAMRGPRALERALEDLGIAIETFARRTPRLDTPITRARAAARRRFATTYDALEPVWAAEAQERHERIASAEARQSHGVTEVRRISPKSARELEAERLADEREEWRRERRAERGGEDNPVVVVVGRDGERAQREAAARDGVRVRGARQRDGES